MQLVVQMERIFYIVFELADGSMLATKFKYQLRKTSFGYHTLHHVRDGASNQLHKK